MVSSEAAPLAKTGGLADVVGALPAALKEVGDEVAVVVPRYGSIDLKGTRRVYDGIAIHLGLARHDVAIYQAPAEFPFYLVDCPLLFDRKGLYGESGMDYPDNHIRFAVFARAALAVARVLFRTEIFHCHDWQAGLVPALLRSSFATDPTFLGVQDALHHPQPGLPGAVSQELRWPKPASTPSFSGPTASSSSDRLVYIKGGIAFADALSTVSPTYAREIQTPEYGFGLDGALRARADVLSGILNGVDYREWSPEIDPLSPARYSVDDLGGKRVCKQRLIEEFGLPHGRHGPAARSASSRASPARRAPTSWPKWPARLVADDVYLVALGPATRSTRLFRQWRASIPGGSPCGMGFDNGLAHRIEAGADMFLMPSRYEPCGLNQIYSLRYGTVPVVRATGGLDDTIEEGTGFKFREYSGPGASGRGAGGRAGVFGLALPGRKRCAGACKRTFPGRRRPRYIRRSTGGFWDAD